MISHSGCHSYFLFFFLCVCVCVCVCVSFVFVLFFFLGGGGGGGGGFCLFFGFRETRKCGFLTLIINNCQLDGTVWRLVLVYMYTFNYVSCHIFSGTWSIPLISNSSTHLLAYTCIFPSRLAVYN